VKPIRVLVPEDVYEVLEYLTVVEVKGKLIKYRSISDVVREALVRGASQILERRLLEGVTLYSEEEQGTKPEVSGGR
jgi:Arc/MetJ-type ribon-helix-helix transcriptional regulator